MSDRLSKIRNFCIIAHIDHGKSTLADRILETTGVFQKREMVEQILDSMELERERGITIKSKAVHMHYTAKDGKTYTLNLIDTPGHVDFTYEVSRALAACEGALLVVDATQGIEAQTLANCYMALDHDLEIIPVINKIDLPSAQPEEVRQEIEDVIGLDASYAPCVSAKTGLNIDQVLEAVVNYVPAPQGDENAPLQALIFDAFYDNYRGAICFIRVKQGTIRTGMRMRMMATGGEFDIVEVGTFAPSYQPCDELKAGDVGYVAASIKDVRETRVGDTITDAMNPADCPLPGYRQVTPMVYCGVYPADGADYPALKDALEKLRMNDASLSFDPETSVALGYGFRCGFLGLLHMDIITERLEREWDLNLVTTAPSVIYRITKTDGTVLMCDNPMALPPIGEIAMMEEPFVHAEIFTPQDSVGTIMDLCQDRRGIFLDMQYEGTRVKLNYDIPLNEIIFDFLTRLRAAAADTPRSTTNSRTTARANWSSWIFCSTAKSATRSPSSSTATRRTGAGVPSARSSKTSSRGRCSRFRFRRPSAARSSRVKPSRRCARTCWQSATAATSAERKSCWKSRKRARSECGSSARCKCPARHSLPC